MLNSHILIEAKNKSLEVSKHIIDSKWFSDTKINEGELITFDFIVDEDEKIHLLEINTDIALTDFMLYGQTTFSFSKLFSFIYNHGYKKYSLVCRDTDEGISPTEVWDEKFNGDIIYETPRQGNEFNTELDRFYIKNIPTHQHGDGLITISRHKDLFRQFMREHNIEDWMPKQIVENFGMVLNHDWPDLVVKNPRLDNMFGLEFKNDMNTKYEYCEEFIVPKTDEYGNPITIKGLVMLTKHGPVWLREDNSKFYWSEIINYYNIDEENWGFNKTGIWAQVESNTEIIMGDLSKKKIKDIQIDDEISISDIFKGHHYPKEAEPFKSNDIDINDDTLEELDEPWRTYESYFKIPPCNSTALVRNIHKFNFLEYMTINNMCVSPSEFIYINRDDKFKFVKSVNVINGDYLVNSSGEFELVTKTTMVKEEKEFYGLDVTNSDTYCTDKTIVITTHQLPKA